MGEGCHGLALNDDMRLFEAIVEANHRALAGDEKAGLHVEEFADALPIVALTCIDPRLNPLMPEVLGIPEAKFIWLRNSGNIIFDPMSTMTRTLALASAVKDGKEIAIIGHTDCHVRKTSMAELTDRFKALGIERSRLPENLNEFFGLFASERQNVIRSTDVVRSSPLIGPKIPVHGLLVDIETGKLEWIVNGYEAPATHGSQVHLEAKLGGKEVLDMNLKLPDFNIGEMKFPEFKIGGVAIELGSTPTAPQTAESQSAAQVTKQVVDWRQHIARHLKYKVVGSDQKQYGPISGIKLLEWLGDERIDGATQVQVEGSSAWKTLADLANQRMGQLGKHRMPPTIPLTS